MPIINENDAVSSAEIKFGDNDKLSALVASLLPADLLVILTTVDGVVENFGESDAKTISVIEQIDAAIENMVGGTTSDTAVGGMASKVQAAKIVVRSGIPLVIASGRNKNVLARVLAGEDEGTLFVAQPTRLQGRKRWIAFFHHPKGTLFVDDGAKKCCVEAERVYCRPVSRVVKVIYLQPAMWFASATWTGLEFARGIARFDSTAVRERKLPKEELVHRDDLVIL